MKIKPIEEAPKGSPEGLSETPRVLLLFNNNNVSVGYWDWYYAEGGRGYEGGLAWVEPISGERLDMHYDNPIGWMELPC